jgi:hypothetical protein
MPAAAADDDVAQLAGTLGDAFSGDELLRLSDCYAFLTRRWAGLP